jgi:two-component system chemotaxis sensor kinase CheA
MTAPAHEEAPPFHARSVLGELPGYSVALDAETTGAEAETLFKEVPNLPGIALVQEGVLVGAISQAHFYKVVSRKFGREIYHPRPLRLLLEEAEAAVLTLSIDCGIQEAVERCLNRSPAQIYEPFLVTEPESSRFCICSFQSLLLASAQIAALRNRQMAQILDSITEGLLLIGLDGCIGPEYSKAVERIFERRDLAGESFLDLVRPLLDSVLFEQGSEYVDVLFNPDLIDDLIKEVNPWREMVVSFPPDSGKTRRAKHLSFGFERVRSAGTVVQIMVRIEDITRRVLLAKELEERQGESDAKTKMMMEAFRAEPGALGLFLENYDAVLERIKEMLEVPKLPREILSEIFRRIHGLKGDAGHLRLSTYESRLHQFEEQLAQSLEKENPDAVLLRRQGEELAGLSAPVKDFIREMRRGERDLPPVRIPGPVEHLASLIPELERRTGKKLELRTLVKDGEVPPCYHGLLREVLPHLARNAVVHGIEAPEERRRHGKTEAGTIQLAVRRHPKTWEVIFQDDGRGLDPERLRRRAAEMGLEWPPGEDVQKMIFHPGFSTADMVDGLAGRGMGMDAVREALRRCGGEIIPHSQPDVFCAFQIILPCPEEKEIP